MPPAWAYFDTSAVVKRYVREEGGARARALLRRYRFVSSAVAPVEAVSALCRRRAAGELADAHLAAVIARMRADRAYWELVEVSPLVLARAEELVERTALRSLDAIHMASALLFQAAGGARLPFVTADVRQREAAGALALDVVWVGP